MARTIIVDEIKKDEAATAMSVDGVAKAWCNLNGTGTIAIRDSLNISSVTDNGTGDYTKSFTSNLTDGNYVITNSYGKGSGGWAAQANGQIRYGSVPAVGSYSLTTGNSISAALTDFDMVHSAVHGDLA